jgi:hypothetical protein
MAEKKKPKPGPSTGGSSTSRIKRPKGSQPLTLGTGGIRTGKVSKKQMSETRKVAATVGTLAFPGAKAARAVASFVSKQTAKTTAAGAPKTVTRTFKQGKKDSVTVTPPKRTKVGVNSPVKGTKVTVERQTRAQTPLQVTTLTKGRAARETTKKTVTFAKGAATGAYTTDRVNQGKKKKK